MRWMGGLMLEDSLTIYMAGAANARKMDQVRDNPLAQLMFHADNFAQVVTIFGACAVVDDPDIKDKLWEAMPVLGRYFSGPEDPHFGVLRFDPKRIELLAMQEHELGPEVVEL
jgi:general stress protein 26